MKCAHLITAWLILALNPVAPARAQTSDTAAVRRVVAAIAEMSQAGNIAALDTLFAHDAWVQVIEGAGVNHGWLDYRDHHLKPELERFRNFRLRYFDVEPQVRGNVAWAALRYEVAFDGPQGHSESEGRGTVILEKRDGRWVVVHRHTSGRRREQPR